VDGGLLDFTLPAAPSLGPAAPSLKRASLDPFAAMTLNATVDLRAARRRAGKVREFERKVAVVTGGASGIGYSLARALGREKMRVMLADIEVDALDSAVAELKSEGIDARGVECDVADRASVQRAAAETLAAFHKIHVVCSNAGVIAGGPMELITPGDWRRVDGLCARHSGLSAAS
jgi:hypothetical protein